MDSSRRVVKHEGPAHDLLATVRELERADAHLASMEAHLLAILDEPWDEPGTGKAADLDDTAEAWSLKSELLDSIGRRLRPPAEAVLDLASSVDGDVRDSGDALLRLLDEIGCRPPRRTGSAWFDPPPVREPAASVDDRWRDRPLDPAVVEELRALACAECTPGFLEDIVSLFSSELGVKLAALEEAFAAGDTGAVLLIAHEMNGCAGQVGAAVVAGICRRIEVACVAGDGSLSASDVEELRDEFDRARAALGTELSTPGSQGRAA